MPGLLIRLLDSIKEWGRGIGVYKVDDVLMKNCFTFWHSHGAGLEVI